MKFSSILKYFSKMKLGVNQRGIKEVGIDLGTANTVVYVKGEGIQIDEPTYVAINVKTDEIDSVGEKAREVVGRTALHTKIIRPLKNGVISDYEITEKMLTSFLAKIKKDKFQSTRVVICIPSGVTQVERRAVVEVVKDSGAKEVYLIEEPVAAAIGCGIDIFQPKGYLIVDIGGGTTEIAFIASGGATLSKSIKVAGDKFNEDIVEYVRDKHNLYIGERTAEDLKIKSISSKKENEEFEIKGREVGTGLPKNIKIVKEEVESSLSRHTDQIIEAMKSALEEIEPEVAADIFETGVYLSGGGAEIIDIKKKIEENFKLKVTVSENPIYAVINGIAKVLDDFELYRNIIITENESWKSTVN